MTINVDFDTLDTLQQEKVQCACDTDEGCKICVVYIGKTSAGEHTYFLNCGLTGEFIVLPVADENPHIDYKTCNIIVAGREFTENGEEVLCPQFEYLCHFDIRKWHPTCRKDSFRGFLTSEQVRDLQVHIDGHANSIPPERAAKALGLPIGQAVPWIGHFYLKPWELTNELFNATVALTILRPNGDRIVLF
jgi:hypothetical protein